MLTLAISTSGAVASACLLADGEVLAYREHEGAGTHSETLMPLVERILCEAGLLPRNIGLFAADTGPGSFTGVRIGVCAANAMAAALEKPVVGVSSLEALAFGRRGVVCALLDARNGNGYAALFDEGVCALPPRAVVIEELLPTVPAGALFIGDGALLYADAIKERVKDGRVEKAGLRADAVALAAWQSYKNGGAQRELLPLYLRPSQAERLYKEK